MHDKMVIFSLFSFALKTLSKGTVNMVHVNHFFIYIDNYAIRERGFRFLEFLKIEEKF